MHYYQCCMCKTLYKYTEITAETVLRCCDRRKRKLNKDQYDNEEETNITQRGKG